MSVGEALLIVLAYLGGSLPFGYWAGRLAGVDVRKLGSGNTGATNVWRVLGRRVGIPVLLLDMAKGLVPALVGDAMFGPGVAIVAGSAAVLGHTFPILLGFGGGKGVATTGGVVFAITPIHATVLVVFLVIVLWLFRYVSLASMLTATAYPASSLATGEPWPVVLFGVIAAVGIVARHRTNIRRLLDGTETKARGFGRGARAGMT